MCLDVHPDHPFLLAVGLYDGKVAVYDFREGTNNPMFQSDARTGKHTDPVWQVCVHVHCTSVDGPKGGVHVHVHA